ncbi:MAG TPA: VWA domain-containing protein [Solirubrobacteraceae bacterium]|nr:VWA domain-containing protein [Solirubrobacteraceae bacterium]
MSFREPLLLLGLALVPLALAAYVAAQRRRRRYAVRYTNVDVLASVAARTNWTRHLPALLALLALAALLVALGRPERTVAAEQRQAMVVMVTDTSGSMLATDVVPNRLTAAKEAGHALADKLPRDFRLGLVGFGTAASLLVEPTTDKLRVRAGLDGLEFAGRTAMGDGLARGLEAARTPVANELGVPQRLPAAIVLLSDGANTAGEEDPITVAERARRLRVPIYTVALGTSEGYITHTRRDGSTWREPVPPDTTTLQEIARETRGRYFAAADARQLTEIYRTLGTRLATRREKQEVTAAFAGGGLALLVFGMAAAMARGGRLP